jgi:hypothetical protein
MPSPVGGHPEGGRRDDRHAAKECQARLKAAYPDAAHVPVVVWGPDERRRFWDEDGEPPGSTGPDMLLAMDECFQQRYRPSSEIGVEIGWIVVVVRFFGERLLGVTCGRLGQCYRSMVRLALHRHFFPGRPMELDLEVGDRDIYGMGAGDCELILKVVEDEGNKTSPSGDATTKSESNLVQALLSELQFDGFKGAAGEELPRLQNLQADLSDGVIPVYRYPGNYRGDQWTTFPWSPTSLKLKQRVEETLQPLVQQTMNHCVTNYYRHGNDFIAHHSDKDLDLNRQGVIVSLSLGEERVFELRRRAEPQDTFRIRLPHASMLVLGPNTNREWTHAILPNKDSRGVRLSLTMREVKTFQDLSTGRLFGQGVGGRTHLQIRVMKLLEDAALFSGFCILSGVISRKNMTKCTNWLLVGTSGIGVIGLKYLIPKLRSLHEEKTARAFFSKLSSSGTKY